MSKIKVLLGMSGGVDSSVAANVLINEGYEVAGITLELCDCDNASNITDAKKVCDKFGINHISKNLKNEFSHFVIADFIENYKLAKTPNPCIVCNKFIKFGAMLQEAIDLGYDKIATGHYARVKQNENGRHILLKAKDESKDQSYVLYGLTQHQLSHTLFPLGDFTKTEIRKIAEENNLVNANRPDSQDICFVPDGDYASFIERFDGFISKSGDYTDLNGNVLGKHKGIINYTIGQRKGLGIALGKPQFVISKSAEDNTVVLGDEEHLFKTEVIVDNVNFIPFDVLNGEMRVKTKLRYRHIAADSVIYPLENNMVKIVFDEPQRAPSSGQAAVFYDGDVVVGGGTII